MDGEKMDAFVDVDGGECVVRGGVVAMSFPGWPVQATSGPSSPKHTHRPERVAIPRVTFT